MLGFLWFIAVIVAATVVGRKKNIHKGFAVFLVGIFIQAAVSWEHNSTPTQPQHQIPYEIVKQWNLNSNGGVGQAIVVSPEFCNDQDLKELGLTLRYSAREQHDLFVRIFDDKNAAIKGVSFTDKHSLGLYVKQPGFHRFRIWNRVGSIISVDY